MVCLVALLLLYLEVDDLPVCGLLLHYHAWVASHLGQFVTQVQQVG